MYLTRESALLLEPLAIAFEVLRIAVATLRINLAVFHPQNLFGKVFAPEILVGSDLVRLR